VEILVNPEEDFHPGVMAITLQNRVKTKIGKSFFRQNPEKEPVAVPPDRQ
jgi:hypothetical protein